MAPANPKGYWQNITLEVSNMATIDQSENSCNQPTKFKVRYIHIDLDLQGIVGTPACILLDTLKQLRANGYGKYFLLKDLQEQTRLKRHILKEAIQILIDYRIIERFPIVGHYYEYAVRPKEMWNVTVRRILKIGHFANGL